MVRLPAIRFGASTLVPARSLPAIAPPLTFLIEAAVTVMVIPIGAELEGDHRHPDLRSEFHDRATTLDMSEETRRHPPSISACAHVAPRQSANAPMNCDSAALWENPHHRELGARARAHVQIGCHRCRGLSQGI